MASSEKQNESSALAATKYRVAEIKCFDASLLDISAHRKMVVRNWRKYFYITYRSYGRLFRLREGAFINVFIAL